MHHHPHPQQPQQPRRLVVGGHNIEPERYPYFVSIDKNNGVIVQGALIAPDIVLSAGHVALNHMDNLTLKVGPYAVHNATESFAETGLQVERWVVPSNWTEFLPAYFDNDYLILKLTAPSTHQPIRINRDVNIPLNHQRVILTGLGWLNESYLSPASIVQQAELVTLSNDDCQAAADPSRGLTYQGKITSSMLCTKGPPNTTRDACAWDSGAPIIIAGPTPAEDILVGLGSTGIGCADPVFPGIQARVASEFGLAWIREQVCQLSVDPPKDFACDTTLNTTTKSNATTTSSSSFTYGTDPAVAPATTTAAALIPRPFLAMSGSNNNRSHDGSANSTPVVLAGLAVAILALVVAGRTRTPRGRRAIFLNRPQQRQQPMTTTYGSIDC